MDLKNLSFADRQLVNDDYESISYYRDDPRRSRVIFASQYKSAFFDYSQLSGVFEQKLKEISSKVRVENPRGGVADNVTIEFQRLRFLEHAQNFQGLFTLMRSADLGVFELSDKNPNVLFELGLFFALSPIVLPVTPVPLIIREINAPVIPSDISGLCFNLEYFVDTSPDGKVIYNFEPDLKNTLMHVFGEIVRLKSKALNEIGS